MSDQWDEHYSQVSFQNVTLVVTTIINEPYTMYKDSAIERIGNEQFEGFAVDLIEELSKLMGFKYRFKLVSDGKYGIKGNCCCYKMYGNINTVIVCNHFCRRKRWMEWHDW